jgi:hypothetical protein
MVPSVHPMVCFLFFSLLGFAPRKLDYLLNLSCDILASLGPRNIHKDMLNNVVSPIDHVVMNHQNQTRTNGKWGHVHYNVMDIVIHMSCLCFLRIFGREKQEKNKKLGQFVVRLATATGGKLTILCRAPRHKTHGNRPGPPGAWTILCCAPSSTTHGKGPGPPCAWTILCRAPPCDARQRPWST